MQHSFSHVSVVQFQLGPQVQLWKELFWATLWKFEFSTFRSALGKKITNVFFIIFEWLMIRKKVQISGKTSKIVWNNYFQSQTSGSRGLNVSNWSIKLFRHIYKGDILWDFVLFDLSTLSSSLSLGNSVFLFQLKIFTECMWDQAKIGHQWVMRSVRLCRLSPSVLIFFHQRRQFSNRNPYF